MKKYISSIQTVLILALVIIVLLQRGCKRNVTPDPEVITKIETKWDTVKVLNTEYVPSGESERRPSMILFLQILIR